MSNDAKKVKHLCNAQKNELDFIKPTPNSWELVNKSDDDYINVNMCRN